jgi:serine acetyltransferase/acyl carrier protein
MSRQLQKELKEVLVDVLDVDALSDEDSVDTVANWSSLRHLTVIMAVEERFGVRFRTTEIPELISVGAISAALQKLANGTRNHPPVGEVRPPSEPAYRRGAAAQQLSFLSYEVQLVVNRRSWRWLSCWFNESFCAVAIYRLDRMLYLLFGRSWQAGRTLLSPLFFLLRPWFHSCDINYRAEIGRGFKILHPSLGAAVSGHAVIGTHFTLTGANVVGGLRGETAIVGDITIGNNVTLGAHAVVLGPIRVGDNVQVGAGSVAVENIGDNETVFCVAPVPVFRRRSSPVQQQQ